MNSETIQTPLPVEACTFVGRDQSGHWVVRDGADLYGGVFVDRTEALRFAHDEGLAHMPHRAKLIFVDELSF